MLFSHLFLFCVFYFPASLHSPFEIWNYIYNRGIFPISFYFHILILRPYEITTDEAKTYSAKTVTDSSRLLKSPS